MTRWACVLLCGLCVFWLAITPACSPKVRMPDRDSYFGQIPDPVEFVPQKTYPGSLWRERNSESLLFMDHKASQVNDIVTVLIVESSSGIGVSDSKFEKETDVDLSVGSLFGLPQSLGMSNFLGLGEPFQPSVGAKSKNDFESKGKTNRTGSLQATITCRVIRVFPNANLEIRGSREVSVNREKQILVLSGVIRQEDIDALNRIRSDRVADARIEYYGEGIMVDKESPGWLARILDWVWPF